jgi:hypothetical protein
LRAGGLVIDPDALFTADRVLRYAAEYKTNAEPLAQFVRRKGGIHKCAERFTRCLERTVETEGAPRLYGMSPGCKLVSQRPQNLKIALWRLTFHK